MASTQLLTTHSVIEEHVAETSVEEKPAVEEAGRGFWGTFRWRGKNVFWNYMGLQAQLGLYGSSDEFGDP